MSIPDSKDFSRFLRGRAPFDMLEPQAFEAAIAGAVPRAVAAGETILTIGEPVTALHVVVNGGVDLVSAEGVTTAQLTAGNTFGQRALLRDGKATDNAVASGDGLVFAIPAEAFEKAMESSAPFRDFYTHALAPERRAARADQGETNLATLPVRDLMTRDPVCIGPDASAHEAAALMRDRKISCLLVTRDGLLDGIVTDGDIARGIVAAGIGGDTPVSAIMTASPVSLSPGALGFDALLAMTERGIGHMPVTDEGKPVGIITQTDLLRRQSVSIVYMVRDIGRTDDVDRLAAIVSQIPALLAQLTGSGMEAHHVTRIITSVADALTKRLLALYEARNGAAPVPWLWLACGSQGRQEQTGVSDQDNCLILHDDYDAAAHGAYFTAMAKFVSDGLDKAGYFYCPGDMMATNDKWRQPLAVWRGYFHGWIAKPDPMAQMLSSVMFDLRPIGGDQNLYEGLHAETLERASANSIFQAHMIANSLKHTPPLNLFRGFALIRSGDHKNTVDLKHNGVVPIVDLARAYALKGKLLPVNTRTRLTEARDNGVVSTSGAADLIDAYDLICETRLAHQARQIRNGEKPDNFMAPASLSALERNHLREAFGVIKTMQSALGYGRTAAN
ncbi:MAG: cyclic nucleotide-binding/CBS domain-containing protein [Brucellaceae bacterium]|nr:cyclic nucleotide-binding/CBS domain-containing protein [Brucellaceae bacterium]